MGDTLCQLACRSTVISPFDIIPCQPVLRLWLSAHSHAWKRSNSRLFFVFHRLDATLDVRLRGGKISDRCIFRKLFCFTDTDIILLFCSFLPFSVYVPSSNPGQTTNLIFFSQFYLITNRFIIRHGICY